ncbi:hypothetical protein, partial [Thiobacillus sp.]
ADHGKNVHSQPPIQQSLPSKELEFHVGKPRRISFAVLSRGFNLYGMPMRLGKWEQVPLLVMIFILVIQAQTLGLQCINGACRQNSMAMAGQIRFGTPRLISKGFSLACRMEMVRTTSN